MKVYACGIVSVNHFQTDNFIVANRINKNSDYNYDKPINLNFSPAFSGLPINKTRLRLPFEELEGLTCIYCGEPIISPKTMAKIKWPEDLKPVSAVWVIKDFYKIKNKMNKYERKILTAFEKRLYKNPNIAYDELIKGFANLPPIFKQYENKKVHISPPEVTKQLLKTLNQFKDKMHPIEKEVFSNIKELNKQYPTKNLKDLLALMRNNSLESLNNKQFNILDILSELSLNLEPEKRSKVQDLIKKATCIINANNIEYPFRRKPFLTKLVEIIKEDLTNQHATTLWKEALKLPHSQNSSDAFIVKYTSPLIIKDKTTGKKIIKQRSELDIAKAFIEKARYSEEHTYPQASDAPKEIINSIYNKSCCCKGCNSNRNETPLDIWLYINPNIPQNAQKQTDWIIDKINQGKIKYLLDYPLKHTQILNQASNGKIALNIPT